MIVPSVDQGWEHWLPIASKYPDEESDQGLILRTLWALARTCRCLRALALPVLWSSLSIERVHDLARLHKILQVSPYLGQYVQSFVFDWTLPGIEKYNFYPESEGTMLDLAFRNRWELWNNLLQSTSSQIETNDEGRYFVWDDAEFNEPMLTLDRFTDLDLDPPQEDDGPDSEGEDCFIASPHELITCLVEVVELLPSLKAFTWKSPVLTVPTGVLTALEKLETLRSFSADIHIGRTVSHAGESLICS